MRETVLELQTPQQIETFFAHTCIDQALDVLAEDARDGDLAVIAAQRDLVAHQLENAYEEGFNRKLVEVTNLWMPYLDMWGRYEEAAHFAARALQIAGEMEYSLGRAEACLNLARVAERRGELDRAEAYARQGLVILADQPESESLQASLTHALAAVAINRGALQEAEAHFTKALRLARAGPHTQPLVRVLASFGALLAMLGQLTDAGVYLQEARALAETTQDLRSLTDILINLGVLDQHLGRLDQAEASLQQGLALAERLGFREREVSYLDTLGVIANLRGQLSVAILHQERALRVATQIGQRDLISHLHANMAAAYIQTREYDHAEATIAAGLETARAINNRWNEAELLLQAAIVARMRADLARAAVHLDEADRLSREIGELQLRAAVLVERGEWNLAAGWLSRAQEAFEEALTCAIPDLPEQAADAHYGLGRVAERQGDIARAKIHGDEGLRLAQSIGINREAEIAQWLAAVNL